MIKNKEVIWVGGKSIIPGYGEAIEGDTKLLPIEMAESFVKQGLAKWPGNTSSNKTEKGKV